MRAFADKSQERQSRAVANEQRKGTYMVDNRPEMAVQRKMVEMARKYGEQQALQRKLMFTSSKEAVQKKGPEDEDELQFKAKDAVQLKGPEDEDELQLKSKEAVQKKGPEDEDELQFKAKDVAQRKGPEDEDELQFKAEEPVQKQENRTGLPDDLKAGVENLSGYAMDDVRVHYNSGKPAQLNAYAYTQGTEIHVAPGQEKHLPHEAWHVVQQKQGRVQPTMQMKGGVAVNDDKGLEKEAEAKGSSARQAGEAAVAAHNNACSLSRVSGQMIQKVAIYVKTNQEHTELLGEIQRDAPTGSYLYKNNAGEGDTISVEEQDAWIRARGQALNNRPYATNLYPNENSLRMNYTDGDRTYYVGNEENKNKAASVIATHNRDKQSKFLTETNELVAVTHCHSAKKEKRLLDKEYPNRTVKYVENQESKVHHFSLKRQ